MSIDRRRLRIAADQVGLALDRVVMSLGSDLSRSAARRLVMAGAVRLNDRECRSPGRPVALGDRVEAAVDAARLDPTGPTQPGALTLSEDCICFEDEWLIVVDKPAGLPTHATVDPRRAHLHGEVARLLVKRSGGGDERPYLGIHHRLDVDTSGLVLFTKATAANAGVARLFAERRIEKTYVALCGGSRRPPEQWEVRNHLARRPGGGGSTGRRSRDARYGAVTAGGDLAHTSFTLLGATRPPRPGRQATGQGWLVEARPHTGRTHQIRVHLAEDGWPIVGDTFYGGPPGPRALLHAARLVLPHPVEEGRVLRVEAPWPPDVPRPA